MSNGFIDKQLVKKWIDGTKGYINLIISLSTSALALSITFVTQILGFNVPRLALGICWVSCISRTVSSQNFARY